MGRGSMHPTGTPRRISQTKEAMLKCEHCASHNLRWFTPRSYAHAAVLLCMACRRLTIVPPHARSAEHQDVEAQQAA